MKLYTEEQLLNTIKSIRLYDDLYDWKVANERIEKHLKALHPIELPTDEEIENYYGKVYVSEDWEGFKRGTKWMRDKIQGGNQ